MISLTHDRGVDDIQLTINDNGLKLQQQQQCGHKIIPRCIGLHPSLKQQQQQQEDTSQPTKKTPSITPTTTSFPSNCQLYSMKNRAGSSSLTKDTFPENHRLQVKQVVCSMNNCFLLTTDGHVYGDLKNKLFEAIPDYSHHHHHHHQWRHAKWFSDKKIDEISCGYYHLVLISRSSNIIYTFSFNNNNTTTTTIRMKRLVMHMEYPQLLSQNSKITTLVSGAYHSIVLTDEPRGNCYGWNYYYIQQQQEQHVEELPTSSCLQHQEEDMNNNNNDNNDNDNNKKKKTNFFHHLNHPLLMNEHIVQAVAGFRMTLFLSNRGQLFSCGNNCDGSLFLGYKSNHPESLQRVMGLPGPIDQVWSGYRHAMVKLKDQDRFFICGSTEQSQLEFALLQQQQQQEQQVSSIVEPLEIDLPGGHVGSSIQLSGFYTCFISNHNEKNEIDCYGPGAKGKMELPNTLGNYDHLCFMSGAFRSLLLFFFHFNNNNNNNHSDNQSIA